MELKRTLSLLGIMLMAIMIKVYFENKKGRKKWKMDRQNDFTEWMNNQFAKVYIDGHIAANATGTVVFQYWESENLITVFISPKGFYCRYTSFEEFVKWPIYDIAVAPAALTLRDQLQDISVKLLPSQTSPIPKAGFIALHLLTTSGWQSTGMPQPEAIQQAGWQELIKLEKEVAAVYKKQLPLHDR